MQLSFLTPVQFHTHQNWTDALVETVDKYCSFWDSHYAVVIPGNSYRDARVVKIQEDEQSILWRVAIVSLKVLSYFTLVIPAVMWGTKFYLRAHNNFEVAEGERTIAPESSDSIYCCGDIHGERDAFQDNLRQAGLIDDQNDWIRTDSDKLVQMGDVIDRGPKSIETYGFLEKIQTQAPVGSVIRLLGNHELNLLMGFSSDSNVPNPEEFVEKIRSDVIAGKIKAAYTDGRFLYVHGGLCQDIQKILVREIQLLAGHRDQEVTINDIVDRLNAILIEAVRANHFAHPIFWTGKSRGGMDPAAGIFWADFNRDLRCNAAVGIPQIVAHAPPGIGERPIRVIQKSGQYIINVDAGLCKYYGGKQAILKVNDAALLVLEKISNLWVCQSLIPPKAQNRPEKQSGCLAVG